MNDAIDSILSELKSAKMGLGIDELTKKLGIDKKQITLALTTLMSEGRIMQKQELENDKYMIKPAITDDSEPSGLSDMNGCPCFHCLRISKCGIRQPDSPADCSELEEWMGASRQVPR
jgi:hypothetical protein